MLFTWSRVFFASNRGKVRFRPRRAPPRELGSAIAECVELRVGSSAGAAEDFFPGLRAFTFGAMAYKIVATMCLHHSRWYGHVQSASTWPSALTRIAVRYGSRALPSTVPRMTVPAISSDLTFPRRAHEAPRVATSLDVAAFTAASAIRVKTLNGVGFDAALTA